MESNIQSNKILCVFDFDHTILSANSDVEILSLLTDESHKYLEPKREVSKNWANFMQEVYLRMKEDKVELSQVKKIVESIQFNNGYKELFELIKENKDRIDTLIISGANTLFLKWVLEKRGLGDLFQNYYSNWADPCEEKLINIRPHHQHDCQNCDQSQCKKLILTKHLEELKNSTKQEYTNILYAGDGENDYCVGTMLREQDVLFPRINFPLDKKLYKKGGIDNIKSQVHLWKDAFKIIEVLKKLL